MYCMTLEANQDVMRRLGYDTCVRINKPSRFIRAISNHLNLRGLVERQVEINYCFYESRDRDWLLGQPPQWLVKDPKFKHQKEARAFWVPTFTPIEPLFVESMAAASHCELHSFPSFPSI